jgi:hypothetical protein
MFMGPVKFIINHDTIAAKTLHKEIFLPAYSNIIGRRDGGIE